MDMIYTVSDFKGSVAYLHIVSFTNIEITFWNLKT